MWFFYQTTLRLHAVSLALMHYMVLETWKWCWMHSTPHKTFVIMILNPISFTSIFIRYINADTCIKSSRENAVYINYLYCKCTRTNKQRGLDKKKKSSSLQVLIKNLTRLVLMYTRALQRRGSIWAFEKLFIAEIITEINSFCRCRTP